jgi:NADPH:quinone reductase-like Zn-dependent oxidoreductase
MNKIVIHKPGGYGELRLERQPDTAPGRGEVRIAVRHAGVNYADCVTRMGLYESAKRLVGWPITPGFEVAGVVDAVGTDVVDLEPGDAVLALTLFGGYASRVVVPRAQVFRIPAQLDSAQAASIPVAFLTAWFALIELASLRGGEKVLIHSAAGGVGGAAIQIARVKDAEVTAVIGAAHKRATAEALGAQHVVDKSATPLWEKARTLSPQGYDVILDANGASTLADSYRHLAPLGRLVVYGFHSMLPRGRGGRPNWFKLARDYLRTPRFNPLRMTVENRSVLAFNLSFLSQRSDLLLPAMRQILSWLEHGRLQALPVKCFPFEHVADAHRELESGKTVGKLVLEL